MYSYKLLNLVMNCIALLHRINACIYSEKNKNTLADSSLDQLMVVNIFDANLTV